MKSLSVSERYGWSRYVGHQVYYSLVGRDYEWELMPLAARAGRRRARLVAPSAGAASPAGVRRGHPIPETSPASNSKIRQRQPVRGSRTTNTSTKSSTRSMKLPQETGKSVPQIALNWLLRRPTVSTVIIGARHEEQLRAEPRLGGLAALPRNRSAKLDAASATSPYAYPYWHQVFFKDRNPFPIPQG